MPIANQRVVPRFEHERKIPLMLLHLTSLCFMLSSHTALHGAFCVMALVRLYRGFCVLAGTCAYPRWLKRLIRVLKSLQCYTGNTYTIYRALHTGLCHSCVNCLDMAPVCPYTDARKCVRSHWNGRLLILTSSAPTLLFLTHSQHITMSTQDKKASALDLALICQDDKELSSYW